MRDFKQLKVWQKAHRLVLDIYRHARGFPPEERYGLTAQLLKSATSVPSNMSSGWSESASTASRSTAHSYAISTWMQMTPRLRKR